MKLFVVLACVFASVFANVLPATEETQPEAPGLEASEAAPQSPRSGRQFIYYPNPAANVHPAYAPIAYNYYQAPYQAYRFPVAYPQHQPVYGTPAMQNMQAVALSDMNAVPQDATDAIRPQERFLFYGSTVVSSSSTTSTITGWCKYNIFTSSTSCWGR